MCLWTKIGNDENVTTYVVIKMNKCMIWNKLKEETLVDTNTYAN